MGLTHSDGVSVTGSGLYRGASGSEVPLFPVGNAIVDSGTTGFSGALTGISTRLTSIIGVTANEKRGAITSGAATVAVNWSGGAIDLYRFYTNTSAGGAGAASGIVSWVAIGT
uniref:Tail protein n=1 Tax=viral metagenome TaxID=1070528 RepID=A0A6H1ZLT8_9ZZZZ